MHINNQGIDYQYDGHKKRVKVVTPTKTVYYIDNLAEELLYRYNVTKNKDTEYINLNGKLIAKLDQGPNVLETMTIVQIVMVWATEMKWHGEQTLITQIPMEI